MKLCSIRSMPMNERYDDSFISPFVHFQQIVRGMDILQILWDSHYQVVSNLISAKLVGQQSSISDYVVESFNSWCNEQREIVLNLKWLYNFTHNFVHLKVPNLLLFDNLSILFVNCEVIQCHCTGVINALYLGHLIGILEHINTNNVEIVERSANQTEDEQKYPKTMLSAFPTLKQLDAMPLKNRMRERAEKKKLRRIALCGVTCIKMTDSEFTKFSTLMTEKVHWRMEVTTDSVLTVSRMSEGVDPF